MCDAGRGNYELTDWPATDMDELLMWMGWDGGTRTAGPVGGGAAGVEL